MSIADREQLLCSVVVNQSSTQEIGDRKAHNDAVSDEHLASGTDETPVGFGRRGPSLENRGPQSKLVAWSHRHGPTQFVKAWRTQTRNTREEVVSEEPHEEGVRMKAARGESAEGASARVLRIHVEGLGVEVSCEGDDLFIGHAHEAVFVDSPLVIVLEVAVIDWHRKVAVTQRSSRKTAFRPIHGLQFCTVPLVKPLPLRTSAIPTFVQ